MNTGGQDSGIRSDIEELIEKAANLRSGGDLDEAEKLLVRQITLLIRDRSNYVRLGRGVGAALGAVTGYILTLIVPGGSVATLLGSLFGTGYLGERVGKYTGEKLSEEEYCLVLKRLHRELLMPGGQVNDSSELRPFWKSLVVLETPLDIFDLMQAEGGILGHLWRSARRLFGADLFALAVEAAKPGTRSFDSILAFASVLDRMTARDREARLVAMHLYAHKRDSAVVNHLMGSLYYIQMGDYVSLKEQHRQLFDEDILRLFLADYEAFPEDPVSVRNLAQAYLEDGVRDEQALPVFRKAVRMRLEPRIDLAVALVEILRDDIARLKLEQEAIGRIVTARRMIRDRTSLSRDELFVLTRLRALYIVENRLADEGSLEICREVFEKEPELEENTLYLARLYLLPGYAGAGDTRDTAVLSDLRKCADDPGPDPEHRRRVIDAAYPLRDRLDKLCAKAMLDEYATSAVSGRDRLRLARLLLESGNPSDAEKTLRRLRSDEDAGLSPAEKLESARMLAVACWHGGKFKRAYELFKGIALIEPSKELLRDIFSFGVDMLKERERPTLARNAFILVRSVDPEYAHPELGPLDRYYQDLRSVFDYYDEDSIRKIGGGGMAVIFEGKEKSTGHRHIIKQLRTDLGTPGEIKRFQRLFSSEIKAIKRLNESDHPGARHIVVLYYESADEDAFCYSMELLDSVLSDRLAEGPPLGKDEAVDIIGQIGLGLACAHSEGVIHRDLNPHNIGFRQGLAKLFDFGTAHILRTTLHIKLDVDDAVQRHAENIILGTPSYMSPEQAAGREFDERTDLFSLAAVAYELLTGEMAFPGRLGSQVLAVDEDLLSTIEHKAARTAGPAAAAAIARALSPDPANRQESVEAFIRELCSS